MYLRTDGNEEHFWYQIMKSEIYSKAVKNDKEKKRNPFD
jgi:hypothetical protein